MRVLKESRLRFAVAVIVILSTLAGQPGLAQLDQFTADSQYTFGESIQFTGQYTGDEQVTGGKLFFRVEGEPEARSGELEISPGNQLAFIYSLAEHPLRAFSDIEYWFELDIADGQKFTSQTESFVYEDNRFAWQVRETPMFRLHWYDGDETFAQTVLDVADLGLLNAQSLIPYSLSEPVDLYAYGSALEMRSALQMLGNNWVGAHTDPDLGVIMLSLPAGPEQRLEMERQIPHELMHILIYQNVGPSYSNLPAWLSEGLASIAELYPNPDYQALLDRAVENENLPAMQSLCQSIPRDASGAYLAYAQAASFTRYLHGQFGSSGIQSLIAQYADGLDCQRGFEATFDLPLSQLDRQWRQDVLGIDIYQAALENLTPFIALLGILLLVPFILIIASLKKRTAGQQPR